MPTCRDSGLAVDDVIEVIQGAAFVALSGGAADCSLMTRSIAVRATDDRTEFQTQGVGDSPPAEARRAPVKYAVGSRG